MGHISTGTGDPFSALLISLMALRLTLVDQNPFRSCYQKIFEGMCKYSFGMIYVIVPIQHRLSSTLTLCLWKILMCARLIIGESVAF